ncbi:MAG: hypothetical protein ACOYOK_07670 [Pseudobdellovibrionaceae bacterium]
MKKTSVAFVLSFIGFLQICRAENLQSVFLLNDRYALVNPKSNKEQISLAKKLETDLEGLWQEEVTSENKRKLLQDFLQNMAHKKISAWQSVLQKNLCRIYALQLILPEEQGAAAFSDCPMQNMVLESDGSFWSSWDQVQWEDQMINKQQILRLDPGQKYNWIFRRGSEIKTVYSSFKDLKLSTANAFLFANTMDLKAKAEGPTVGMLASDAAANKDTETSWFDKDHRKWWILGGVTAALLLAHNLKDKQVTVSFPF